MYNNIDNDNLVNERPVDSDGHKMARNLQFNKNQVSRFHKKINRFRSNRTHQYNILSGSVKLKLITPEKKSPPFFQTISKNTQVLSNDDDILQNGNDDTILKHTQVLPRDDKILQHAQVLPKCDEILLHSNDEDLDVLVLHDFQLQWEIK